MRDWEKLSLVELGEVIQRLYLQLEQYEIHAASLEVGARDQKEARTFVARLRNELTEAAATLDRRLAEATGLGAHTQAGRMAPTVAMRDGTSGNGRVRAV